jgi:hypothetical protein
MNPEIIRTYTKVVTSVACPNSHRLSKKLCRGGGWYGQEGDKCPLCKETVRVTGKMVVTDLRSLEAVTSSEKFMDKLEERISNLEQILSKYG